MQFSTWFFQQFPSYFKDTDTLQDVSGRGLLERYMQTFGDELDENLYGYVDEFMGLFNPKTCPPAYLESLSFILGLPPINGTLSDGDFQFWYRKILQYAVEIYKHKGTKKGYEIFFNILGYDVTLIEDDLTPPVTYDTDTEEFVGYDRQELGPIQYDLTCQLCSGYTLALTDRDTGEPVTDADTLASFEPIICFLQPINATFNGYASRYSVSEKLKALVFEETEGGGSPAATGAFSNGFNDGFDNGDT